MLPFFEKRQHALLGPEPSRFPWGTVPTSSKQPKPVLAPKYGIAVAETGHAPQAQCGQGTPVFFDFRAPGVALKVRFCLVPIQPGPCDNPGKAAVGFGVDPVRPDATQKA